MTKATAPQLTAAQRLAAVPTYLHVADIQGLAQLATQGVLGVTGLAESVQGNVYKAVAASFGPLGKRFTDRSPGSSGIKPFGVTGLVYGGIRGITRLAGGSVNAVLARAVPRLPVQKSSPQREAVLAAVNGVLGDKLLDTANPLAISMSCRIKGQRLPLDKAGLAESLQQLNGAASGKILMMVHGLCMNDLQWTAAGHSPTEILARELGYTPVYLHYNTGLHTSINGQQLDALLEQLLQAWPEPVTELSLLVHSMGGLVARSACQQAEQASHSWRKVLKKIVFLGTPHHGAPLEQLGNWVDTLLRGSAVTRPFAQIGEIRSSGITDLRHGHVLAADWEGNDRFQRAPDARQHLPLPAGVACFAVAGTTSAEPLPGRTPLQTTLANQFFGDGLVSVQSALGLHADAVRNLDFAPDQQWVAWKTGHLELLRSEAVGQQVRAWLKRDVVN